MRCQYLVRDTYINHCFSKNQYIYIHLTSGKRVSFRPFQMYDSGPCNVESDDYSVLFLLSARVWKRERENSYLSYPLVCPHA